MLPTRPINSKQPEIGRQTTYAAGTTRKYTPGPSRKSTLGNNDYLMNINTAKIALMANLSRNGTDALTEKVRESKPKLYDGNVILKMDIVVIPDSDETLMLCEESRSKMLLKEQDPLVNSKKQDNSDYVCINSDDCMSSDNLCVFNSINDVKFHAKPKKSKSKKDIWKPTGKVFTQIGYIWRTPSLSNRPLVLDSVSSDKTST
ncbi:hypothetical protein Tco_0542388 [Tanacetum coccineum]